jgi:membrane fusion protein (multidrug efflux system)
MLAQGCRPKPASKPPPEVLVMVVTPTNVPVFEEWIGTLEGFDNAQIRPQVTGYLLSQNYAEGRPVKKGDLLFQIDPRPFQAVLDQAEAKLAQNQANYVKTRLDLERYEPLAKKQAISQEDLDNAVQARLAAAAQVKADEAAVETARLNLGFTRITSPIDGLAGIALGQVGDLVGPPASLLTTVSTLNPIKVYFQVSEQSSLKFWRRFMGAAANTNQELPLELILSDGAIYPEAGRFMMADRQVNPTTGTLEIVGLFSNADYILRPGQYGRVRAQTHTRTNVMLLPQRALAELQGSYQVVVVDAQGRARLKPVRVGEQVGSNWIVEDGLQSGDRVVIEGIQQAKEGTLVDVKMFSPPGATNDPAMSQARAP